MILAPFTKNWWKSAKKSEDGSEEGVALDEEISVDENLEITEETLSPLEEHDSEIEEHLDTLDPEHSDENPEEEEGYTHEGGGHPELDDPIEEAYEFEQREQRNFEKEERNQPSRSKIRNAKEFFNTEMLYRFDIMEDNLRKQLAGSYRLELKGYQGGIWTVKVGDQLDIVNKKEDSEIIYSMQQRDFVLLVNGQLNPQLAIFAGKMKITGDLKKSVEFIELLAPAE